jgi:hypothetical protein
VHTHTWFWTWQTKPYKNCVWLFKHGKHERSRSMTHSCNMACTLYWQVQHALHPNPQHWTQHVEHACLPAMHFSHPTQPYTPHMASDDLDKDVCK